MIGKMRKKASRKVFQHFLRTFFLMFILWIISNHTVFLVQFEINLHLWVFQKAEIVFAGVAHAISAFWKTSLFQLIPNWTWNCRIPLQKYRLMTGCKWLWQNLISGVILTCSMTRTFVQLWICMTRKPILVGCFFFLFKKWIIKLSIL